jgi:hypothetical protein
MGSRTYWVAPAVPLTYASGTPMTASATLTDISPGATAAPKIVGPPYQPDVGVVLRLRATGSYSATTGAANIGTLGFYWGGIAGTSLASTSSTTLTTVTGAAAWPWWMEYEGEFRAISAASGSIQGQGKLFWPTSLTAWATQPVPQTAAARTITVNTIAATAVTVGANWSSTTGTPSITCDHLSVELVG